MTGLHGYSGPQPFARPFALSKAQWKSLSSDVTKAIGTTGDARHKLGFTVGPVCFDMSDQETRQFIRDSFAVARENDVAVAFHIDDSMSWGQRRICCPIPTTSRRRTGTKSPARAGVRIGVARPTRFPPQMCFNSPAVVAAVKDRAGLIGARNQARAGGSEVAGERASVCGRHRRMGDVHRPRFRYRPSPGLSGTQPSGVQRKPSAQGSGPRTGPHRP